jgi:dipeptidyl aminopeptidase/acylaminoacyl peptidase
MPAVDRVISLGVADPARVFVIGHSFGGYDVFSLTAHSNRFKAAVAISSVGANMFSEYGVFDGSVRYDDQYHDPLARGLTELAQFRMGSPPWGDPARFVRNSAIVHADRIRTPILLMHGDMDTHSMTQSEEMFTALYRLDIPTEFVRYLGEGHVFQSPANIRDMWARIIAWYDRWGDIARDANGNIVWDGSRVANRRQP